MLTANRSGFSISPDASLGQKNAAEPTTLQSRDEDEDEKAILRLLAPSSWLLLPQLRLQEPKSLGSASLNQHCRRLGDPAPVGAAVRDPVVLPAEFDRPI
jgi:hypothetical protein